MIIIRPDISHFLSNLRVLAASLFIYFGFLNAVYAQDQSDNSNAADIINVEGATLPKKFLGLSIGETVKYPEPWLGTSISYIGITGVAIDVYVYNPYKDTSHLFPEHFSDGDLNDHFDQVVGDVYEAQKSGYYRNVNLIESFFLTDEKNLKSYRCAEFEFERVEEGIQVWSLVCLGLLKANYLKVRISAVDKGFGSDLAFRALQYLDTFSRIIKN